MTLETTHRIILGDSRKMDSLSDNSVDLVVTSPPYPMITMWDELFCKINPQIRTAIDNDGMMAFRLMHEELDKTWNELERVVKPGGIVCINIGDATRKIANAFKIYPNHCRITLKMIELGFDPLPEIIWHKQTNAPNKFMGSGMLPCGAYVTLEHEYILIFRKGDKREFNKTDKIIRNQSAYFWEERNEWFSDIWDFKGKKQKVDSETRARSAAFPCELPKRLILMYSMYGDLVLDPFMGTGTTLKAAALFGRNSVGYEIDDSFVELSKKDILDSLNEYRGINAERMSNHDQFIKARIESGKEIKHHNGNYNTPVMTSQEEDLTIYKVQNIKSNDDEIKVEYVDWSCPEPIPVGKKKKQSTLF